MATISTPMARPTSSLLSSRQGSPLMPPLAPSSPESRRCCRPGNHLRDGAHDPAAGTGTVVRTGTQAGHVAGDLVHLLLYPIDDVVHAAGGQRAHGYHDHGEANENLGKRTALGLRLWCRHGLRWGRGHGLRRSWGTRIKCGLRSRSRRLPQVGSALVAEGAPIDGVPHLMQNRAGGAAAGADRTGGAGGGATGACGVAGCGAGLPASRLSYPHFTQKIPLTGVPHLLQKLAMLNSPVTRRRQPLYRWVGGTPTGQPARRRRYTNSVGFEGGRAPERGRLESI